MKQGTASLSSGYNQFLNHEMTSSNAGLDIKAFGSRIEFQSDIYTKAADGILVQPSPFSGSGLQQPPVVYDGSLENKGMELVLRYKELMGDFFSNLGISFSTNSNKVASLDGAISDGKCKTAGYVTLTDESYPIGSFYGYKTNGLFQNWDEINSFTYVDRDGTTRLVQPNAAPGDIRYRDDNHDGEWDKGYLGSAHPDFTAGLYAEIAYKGFDVYFSLVDVYGNELFNGTLWYTENSTANYNLDTRMLNRWTGDGSTDDANFPRMNARDANNFVISDRYIEDGSYVRLQTLQLGYTLNASLSRKFLIKKCRFYVGAENLLTLTRYTGLEPEVGQIGDSMTMGLDRATYPQARTYLAGLKITL